MMRYIKRPFQIGLFIGLGLCLAACAHKASTPVSFSGTPQLEAAANIVDAVNNKDAAQYIRNLHPDVVVKMYEGPVRLTGVEAVRENRALHFSSHPKAYNELIHLVEIDNRVIMHDIVWLDGQTDLDGSHIVEIFTFEEGQIIQIDVVQPGQLFQSAVTE